jgi:hypothetical protein
MPQKNLCSYRVLYLKEAVAGEISVNTGSAEYEVNGSDKNQWGNTPQAPFQLAPCTYVKNIQV